MHEYLEREAARVAELFPPPVLAFPPGKRAEEEEGGGAGKEEGGGCGKKKIRGAYGARGLCRVSHRRRVCRAVGVWARNVVLSSIKLPWHATTHCMMSLHFSLRMPRATVTKKVINVHNIRGHGTCVDAKERIKESTGVSGCFCNRLRLFSKCTPYRMSRHPIPILKVGPLTFVQRQHFAASRHHSGLAFFLVDT
jgi:hypothetical protein